ncbi:toxin-antitoxin system HicB family antitoxin [Zhihengliuella alba]|uniref:Toxin-antitoxin system HicB family antitoxin n=1 Tax=Zhihengliuella alba TaxID=547018 RepID=A0ABP7DS43_9MICC
MDISRHVQELQEQLVESAGPAGEPAVEVARRLTRSLDSAFTLVLLDALSEAAAEITADLAPGSVDVRLRGRNPEFVVTPPASNDTTAVSEAASAGQQDQEPASSEDYTVDGRATRTTLRLPEKLKTRAEAAAATEGLSVNTWLVRAVAAALSDRTAAPAAPPNNSGNRFTGWVR